MTNSGNDVETGAFRRAIREEFRLFLHAEAARLPAEQCLRADLHCHDYNSDIPDELWGRILRLPETWLETDRLVEVLKRNGSDVITITNHNNARSCWALQEAGHDVLTGAEFTCHFAEYDMFFHVLTYGFDRRQESALDSKRRDVFAFLRYAHEQNLPVVLPHPLYFYTATERLDLELFEKLAVMFQRFEVLNGQRDLWQSVLTLNWVQSLTADRIDHYARKHRLDPREFGVDPALPKVLTGGSDDHFGVFAGTCGSRLYVPNLQERLATERPSVLALEAIRDGRVAAFGHVAESQKLTISLLDYFSQVATKIEDPGLLRIALHRGETSDKLACFAIGNLLLEVRKHRNTRKFFNLIHDALQGRRPSRILRWQVSKDYRFCLDHLDGIAASAQASPEEYVDTVSRTLSRLFSELCSLIIARVQKAAAENQSKALEKLSTEELIRKFEVPSQLTALFFGDAGRRADMSDFDVKKILESLSFPVFMNLIVAGATVASTRVLYANRRFLNEFAEHLGKGHHGKRALYLTDTLRDRNGVSSSLSGKLAEIQRLDLPVDFLVCHANLAEEPHLRVVPPLMTFSVKEYSEQEFRIPDPLAIAAIFYRGGYDRIVCSTEGPMALVALFLKFMFNVPGYFFMHTDWIDFAKHMTDLDHHERDRIRRMLRALYRRFEGVFVLNSDHREWLTGREMQLDPSRVYLTAHHAQPRHPTARPIDKASLFPDATAATPIVFVACRLSREKGLFELPDILARARRSVPDLRLVIAGAGPAEADLKAALPDARFLGWVDRQRLAELYLGLDLFVFPSRFDTFGNVILEALAHGMPAVAYNCKGPKDILENGRSGYLVETIEEMGDRIASHYLKPECAVAMREQAIRRAAGYRAEPIMRQFMYDLGLGDRPDPAIPLTELDDDPAYFGTSGRERFVA
jgi:glycosyltransferase involved in cell wall biosynthesis